MSASHIHLIDEWRWSQADSSSYFDLGRVAFVGEHEDMPNWIISLIFCHKMFSNFPHLAILIDGFVVAFLIGMGVCTKLTLDLQPGLHANDSSLCEEYTFGIRTLLFAFSLSVKDSRLSLDAGGLHHILFDTATSCVGVLAV